MLDWLILGGGMHGTHLSFYLTRVIGVSPDRLRVLDPYLEPLAHWYRQAGNTGMEYLRSPHVQNLDHDPWSIVTFARTRDGKSLARYIPKHNRPSLALFRAHTNWLVRKHQLDQLRLVGRANGLTRLDHGWRVETDQGAVDAWNVILAFGATEQPHRPAWANHLPAPQVQHIFAPDFTRAYVQPNQHITVVGGGITAAQTALSFTTTNPGRVTLLMRHAQRIANFDSDECWVGATCLNDFHAEPDFDRRRAIIKAVRHRGSLPPDVVAQLQYAQTQGLIEVQEGEIASVSTIGSRFCLHLHDPKAQATDHVVLATGFERTRPGGQWLDAAVENYELSTAACGFPIVDPTLRWADGLYVCGPLAELEVGPVARNIIGARLAAARIGKMA